MRLNHFIFHKLSKKEQAFLFTILGPFLIVFSTLLLLLKTSSFLALVVFLSCCGVVVSWKYLVKGAVSSIAVLLLTLILFSLFSDKATFSWEILTVLSLSTALVVMGLSAGEHKKLQENMDQERDEKISLLQKDYETEIKDIKKTHQETLGRLDQREQSVNLLSERIKENEVFNTALQSDCQYHLSQIDKLKKETLDLQRQLFEIDAKKIDDIQLGNLYQKNLKELNTLRVDYYQQKLLLEHVKKQASLRGEEETEPTIVETSGVTDIDVLEEERTSLKRYYKQQLRDYKGVQEKLKTLFSIDPAGEEEVTCDGFPEYYANLRSSFQEMTKHLQETRMEIFKTEGNIIELKSRCQISVEVSSPHNYLAIADQECLRLEDENNILLDLLESLFLAYAKKNTH